MNVINNKFRKRYPEQTGKIRVKIKHGRGWQNFNHCRLDISVGHLDDEYFKAWLNWAKDRFELIDILLCDTLQRHNIMVKDNYSEQEAYEKTKVDGQEWVKRNLSSQDLNNPLIRVIHWDEILADPSFSEKLTLIQKLYKEKAIVTEKVDMEINEFISRKESASSGYLFDIEHCRRYLLEELAVFQVLADRKREIIDVYPGAPIYLTITENKDIPEIKALYDTQIAFSINKNYILEQKIEYFSPLNHNSEVKELLIS